MPYTETKVRNKRKYYYRTVSVRDGARVTKQRKYLGADLSRKELAAAEMKADSVLGVSGTNLTEKDFSFLDRVYVEYARLPPETYQERYDVFAALFTHNSTAIEGNSFTLQETGRLLFEDIAPAGKSFREICEVIGHRRAFDRMLAHEGVLDAEFICGLHALVMTEPQGQHSEIGRYRTLPVSVEGMDWEPLAPERVPREMKRLLSRYSKQKGKINPLVLAVKFHLDFELIRPFADGNGRVGRLLMNFILHEGGYPMVSIPNVLKYRYHEVLEKALDGENLRPFLEFMMELMEQDKSEF